MYIEENQTYHKSSFGEGDSGIVQMKGHSFFQREIIKEWLKYIDKILKTAKPILTKLGTKHPWVKGIKVCSNKVLHFIRRRKTK